MIVYLSKEMSGNILDIGGGGESIIGRLYREQVTAIAPAVMVKLGRKK